MTEGGRSLRANLAAALGGELSHAVLGVVVFFGLFFQLDENQWGQYAAVTATGLIIGTVANLGSQEILVRDVARGSALGTDWGMTLTTQLTGSLIGIPVGLLVRTFAFADVSLLTSILLLAINISLFWIVETGVRVGQAVFDLRIGTRSRLIYAAARTLGVAAFWVVGDGELDTYALIAFPLASIGVIATVAGAARATGTTPQLVFPPLRRLVDGFPFVGTAGAQDMLAAFDRPLLSSFGFVAETGQYAVADRIVRLAGIPSMAVVRTTAAEFFSAGALDDRATFKLALKYVRPTAAYGLAASISMIIGSLAIRPLLPQRLADIVPILAALAPITALQAIQLFPANVLTGTDRQWSRTALYGFAAAGNIVLNILWIPGNGWTGAAAATLVAETVLAVALWATAWRVTR